MIPLKFGLFWAGKELSYLRYQTFVSLRKHHPDAEIELYTPKKTKKKAKFLGEKQDFQQKTKFRSYLSKLEDLNVKIVKINLFGTYAPNFQSDLFRWWWLSNNGGFYLDTDQIILRPFHDLPLEKDLIFSMYRAQSCGIYAPVGVIGAKKNSPIVDHIMKNIKKHYKASKYNSLGPFMFREEYLDNEAKWNEKYDLFNAPPHYFYPFPESHHMREAYQKNLHIVDGAFACHWFGGHPASQEFNCNFTAQYARENNDTISTLVREL